MSFAIIAINFPLLEDGLVLCFCVELSLSSEKKPQTEAIAAIYSTYSLLLSHRKLVNFFPLILILTASLSWQPIILSLVSCYFFPHSPHA